MHNSIGSLYLDAPPKRKPPAPPPKAPARGVAAGFLAVIGILGLTAAALLAAIRTVITDPEPNQGRH